MMTRLVPIALALTLAAPAHAATVVLFDQDFENPTGFVNDGHDVNIYRTVNQLYGGQPAGFSFAQANTVETLNITGQHGSSRAFGTGYSDPAGTGGNYALGMLGSAENDLLGLTFDMGAIRYFNFSIDVSSIDLSSWGGPFNPTSGSTPKFRFTLYDNPSLANGLGGGSVLAQTEGSGTASTSRSSFDWTTLQFAFDAQGATNGGVTLVIDLIEGGYAAMDNFRMVASDTEGDLGPAPVPLPATAPLLLAGIATIGAVRRRRDKG